MFVLKKLLGYGLMPLPIGLLLITLGIFLQFRGRKKLAGVGILTGWLIFAIAGNRAVALRLTASLENEFAPVPALDAPHHPATGLPPEEPTAALPEQDGSAPEENPAELAPPPHPWPAELREAGFVAVLGGGHGDATSLPAGQRLSASARARLIEGIRIARGLPDAWLVVSGAAGGRAARDAGANEPPETHARVLADAAVELGFPRERIVEIDTARDTDDEITALRRLAGEERVALVTSAWHLPRAMQLARREQLSVFPCPADFLGGRGGELPPLAWITWDSDSLSNTTRAWREYLGQTWAALVAKLGRSG